MLEESDLALINALQIWPRAPWSTVARSLGINSPDAVARRWRRLAARGDTWITAYFSAQFSSDYCIAIVTLGCVPGCKEDVADALTQDLCCVSVEITAGAQDIVLTVVTHDLEGLNNYLQRRVEQMPGLTATSTSLVTRLYSEGMHWRLRALGASAHAELARGFQPGRDHAATNLDKLDRRLVRLLSADGRTSYAELAEGVGTSPATARRRLTAMLRSRMLALRCEVAAPLVGLPVTVTLRGRVAPDRVDEVAAGLAGLPQVRLCATLTGEHNLLATVWLSSINAVQRLELSLARSYPVLEVRDTLVNLRTPKRMGRLLDQSGRARGHAPIVPWPRATPMDPGRN
ncbi:AsnC family transcriptional regulator [Parasphingorhabdus pacifica]